MKQIERIINPEMNRNRFNEGMTSINALISTTVETYFDKLKSLLFGIPNTYRLRSCLNCETCTICIYQKSQSISVILTGCF